MIRALVFDFDGLILDTETPLIEAWLQLHARAGLPCSPEAALQLIGQVDHDHDLWQAFNADIDRCELEAEYHQLSRELLQSHAILPGVTNLLTEATRRGLPLAIASNSHHRSIDRHLARLGLTELFRVVRCRDDVARGKPEPDIYLNVLAALGVEGREAIAFEDSHAGSLAAKRAGLHCVAVPNACTLQHDFAHADLRLASLADLSLDALLAKWAG